MEHTFQIRNFKPANNYSYTDLIRDSATLLCSIGVLYAVVYIWVPEKVMSSGWILPVLIVTMYFFDKTGKDRLVELTFDTAVKEVVVSYKTMFSAVKEKRVPFDQTSIEMVEYKQSKLKIFEPLTLYLLKGKMEVFEFKRSKDRLSDNDLRAIVLVAETSGIPIVRK